MRNESGGELPWTAAGIPAWLILDPAAGLAPSAVEITASADGLAPGVYSAALRVAGPPDCLNCPLSLPVTLSVIDSLLSTYLPLVRK